MIRPLVVVGAGGFGRETLDVVDALNRSSAESVFEVLGVVDSNPSSANLDRLQRRGVPFLGSLEEWLKTDPSAEYLLGVGSPTDRERLDDRCRAEGLIAATAIHPSATVGSEMRADDGVIVCAGVNVSTNVTLGRHVHLNPGSTVGHDSNVRDYVSINPGAILSGEVNIKERTLVGAGAVVLPGLTIGEGSVVGAAACVVRSVSANTVVKGVPAR